MKARRTTQKQLVKEEWKQTEAWPNWQVTLKKTFISRIGQRMQTENLNSNFSRCPYQRLLTSSQVARRLLSLIWSNSKKFIVLKGMKLSRLDKFFVFEQGAKTTKSSPTAPGKLKIGAQKTKEGHAELQETEEKFRRKKFVKRSRKNQKCRINMIETLVAELETFFFYSGEFLSRRFRNWEWQRKSWRNRGWLWMNLMRKWTKRLVEEAEVDKVTVRESVERCRAAFIPFYRVHQILWGFPKTGKRKKNIYRRKCWPKFFFTSGRQ